MTGARPTGALHLGHYAAIVRPMREVTATGHEVTFVIADLHAMTTHAERAVTTGIGMAGVTLAAQVLASGVSPDAVRFVRQSDVPELSQTFAILQSLVPSASLADMESYKAMSETIESPSLGLLGYPVMEAADAIALQADTILVGEHNVAHVETAQNMVRRIRRITGLTLVTPTPLVVGENLIGLDGHSKMSKSLSNDIGLMLDTDTVVSRLSSSNLIAEISTERTRLLDLLDIHEDLTVSQIVEAVTEWISGYRERTTLLLEDKAGLQERIARDSAQARQAVKQVAASLLDAFGLRTVR